VPQVSGHHPQRNLKSAGILLGFVALAATGCSDTIASISPEPVPAAEKMDQLGEALADRFTNPERLGRFELARRRLVSGALVPSHVFSDTTIWTVSPSLAERALVAHGTTTDQGYRFETGLDRNRPMRLGDTRHMISLTRIGDNQYRWDTNADCAIGAITAADVAAIINSIIAATETHSDAEVRAGALEAYPHTSAALGRAFSIDTFKVVPGPLSTTLVRLTIGVHTERIHSQYPHFADFVDKYVNTSHYRFTLTDRSGAMLFEVVGQNRTLTARFRTQHGHLVTYGGVPRPMTDSLRLSSDVTMKVKLFTVGYKNLVTDFIIGTGEHERSWTMTAHTEPAWLLPLGTEHLVRTPLRRPFEGSGAMFQLVVHDSAGGQTLLSRRTRVELQESAIYRSLASLVAHVFNDLGDYVEPEEAQFLREVFVAIQHDAALAQPPKTPRATNP
jgi:hypothetical protein